MLNTLTPKHSEQLCECCKNFKLCKMYVLQNGEAAWICDNCREGKK